MSIALQNLEVKGALEWNTPLFIIAVGGYNFEENLAWNESKENSNRELLRLLERSFRILLGFISEHWREQRSRRNDITALEQYTCIKIRACMILFHKSHENLTLYDTFGNTSHPSKHGILQLINIEYKLGWQSHFEYDMQGFHLADGSGERNLTTDYWLLTEEANVKVDFLTNKIENGLRADIQHLYLF